MKNIVIIILILGTTAVTIMGFLNYQADQSKTMPLVPMMQLLLSDMRQVDRGIYVEDYKLIEEGAAAIADHPKMTKEDKQLLKKTLGKELKQFVNFDMNVHHHADSMRAAAIEEDMKKILHHYRIVQQGCVDCHSNYRDKILKARKQ